MLVNNFATILFINTRILLTDAWPPSIGAFASFSRTNVQHSQRQRSRGVGLKEVAPTGMDENDEKNVFARSKSIMIEQIALDDQNGLERMSKFCIDTFYNQDQGKGGSSLPRKWKDAKLAAMQKAQMLDISLSAAKNRCIFVARDATADNSDEIIGCCEVNEEKIDTASRPLAIKKQKRCKTARLRPVIENLCVKKEYRRSGVGIALVHACENIVQQWPGHDEIFSQVDCDNTKAFHFFRKCGYWHLYADPTCTKVVLDDVLFMKTTTITKWMMRKILDDGNDLFL